MYICITLPVESASSFLLSTVNFILFILVLVRVSVGKFLMKIGIVYFLLRSRGLITKKLKIYRKIIIRCFCNWQHYNFIVSLTYDIS